MFVAPWWGAGPSDEDGSVVVTPGTSVAALGAQLEEQGLIDLSPERWSLLARVFGGSDPIKVGEFEVPAAASPADIMDIVQHGRPLQRFVTIPEGLPSILVKERIDALEQLTGETPLPEEGSILPQTYDYQRGETRAALIARMQAAMEEALAKAWEERSERAVVNTPEEAIILASIVEKETALPEERRMVAGVMSNRVRLGMMLGADATTIYPITKGKPLGRLIRRSELDDPNPYNTRAISGLPIGPITNPGIESIRAVLDPADTDALYYVADGSGGHVFAKTLSEHNENAARWRQIRRERGEL
ncbi:endolytic transglycosylase MltG [Sphingomicrobium sp. B8]|uniref:Endolytic murein transglycosylase n=2 Tax=Sphingomicrobium clamense TaxID=2851013 RepID=A0ABS6V5D4_9SPHN|nr:endolytic transglycosylase MltG [Sphingomicrobium sp. B8]MBW0144782.1 endolytic transglycosylase MltG [Sphingomicrobium sp. B8]